MCFGARFVRSKTLVRYEKITTPVLLAIAFGEGLLPEEDLCSEYIDTSDSLRWRCACLRRLESRRDRFQACRRTVTRIAITIETIGITGGITILSTGNTMSGTSRNNVHINTGSRNATSAIEILKKRNESSSRNIGGGATIIRVKPGNVDSSNCGVWRQATFAHSAQPSRIGFNASIFCLSRWT